MTTYWKRILPTQAQISMNKILEIFNSRELAISIWIVVLLFLLLLSSFRKNLYDIVRALFVKQISFTILLGFMYTIVGIILLKFAGFWTYCNLKDTVVWMLFSSTATLFKLNTVEKNKKFFSETIKDNFKFSLIIEFISGLHTFSLFSELISLPILLIIAMLIAYSENKP